MRFIIFLLKPHHKNFNKRIVKSPKLYFIDSGLVCTLLGIKESKQIETHFMKGALFENLLISELNKLYNNQGIEAPTYFWRDKSGREIDCLVDNGNDIIALELKASKTANLSFVKNLDYWNLLSQNNPSNSFVVYGGNKIIKNKKADFIPWYKLNTIIK